MNYEYINEIEMDEARMVRDGVDIDLFYNGMIEDFKNDSGIFVVSLNKFTATDNASGLHIISLLRSNEQFMKYVKYWGYCDNEEGEYKHADMIKRMRSRGRRCCYE